MRYTLAGIVCLVVSLTCFGQPQCIVRSDAYRQLERLFPNHPLMAGSIVTEHETDDQVAWLLGRTAAFFPGDRPRVSFALANRGPDLVLRGFGESGSRPPLISITLERPNGVVDRSYLTPANSVGTPANFGTSTASGLVWPTDTTFLAHSIRLADHFNDLKPGIYRLAIEIESEGQVLATHAPIGQSHRLSRSSPMIDLEIVPLTADSIQVFGADYGLFTSPLRYWAFDAETQLDGVRGLLNNPLDEPLRFSSWGDAMDAWLDDNGEYQRLEVVFAYLYRWTPTGWKQQDLPESSYNRNVRPPLCGTGYAWHIPPRRSAAFSTPIDPTPATPGIFTVAVFAHAQESDRSFVFATQPFVVEPNDLGPRKHRFGWGTPIDDEIFDIFSLEDSFK